MRGEDVKYSKYNSSGLYACNSQQGVEDISFDQLFSEISQENFQKFFKMLECAKGNDFLCPLMKSSIDANGWISPFDKLTRHLKTVGQKKIESI